MNARVYGNIEQIPAHNHKHATYHTVNHSDSWEKTWMSMCVHACMFGPGYTCMSMHAVPHPIIALNDMTSLAQSSFLLWHYVKLRPPLLLTCQTASTSLVDMSNCVHLSCWHVKLRPPLLLTCQTASTSLVDMSHVIKIWVMKTAHFAFFPLPI